MFTDNSNEYKEAIEHGELVVPPGLDNSKVQSIYEIPNILGGAPIEAERPNLEASEPVTQPAVAAKLDAEEPVEVAVKNEVAKEEPALSLRVSEGAGYQKAVKINQLGTRYWILSQYSASAMDAALKGFFATQNLQISEQDSQGGMYATAWKKRAGVSAYEQFIFKLRPGLQYGTTELEVVEISAGSPGASANWSASSSIKAREVDMLKRVAKFLSGVDAPLSGRYGQQNDNLKIKEGKQTYLRLGVDYTRTWAAVQEALKKASYSIDQRDSARGLLWVSSKVDQPQKSGGFFSRLRGGSAPADSFVVSVKAIAGKNASAILVQSPDGDALSKSQSKNILNKITYYIN